MTGTKNTCLRNANRLKCKTSSDLITEHLEKSISKAYVEVKRKDTELQQKYLEDNRLRLMGISDQTFWEAKPAARITGKEQSHIHKDDKSLGMVPIREWRHGKKLHDSNGYLRYGVRYRHGRLVVPVDGTYFLYSFLDFFESCDSSTGTPKVVNINIAIKHAIYKVNIYDKAETEIISNVQPHHISKNKYYNSYSSYVSTIAILKAGDEVSVKVSNITYLRYTKDNSFGLYLI
ncbi:uncharacterized protein LOC132751654 isoform X2 [Ruditapes philippinarum]|nr:uncharacterized protein LOC132751654 isoform X2 [Ruditapes philippinarum]